MPLGNPGEGMKMPGICRFSFLPWPQPIVVSFLSRPNLNLPFFETEIDNERTDKFFCPPGQLPSGQAWRRLVKERKLTSFVLIPLSDSPFPCHPSYEAEIAVSCSFLAPSLSSTLKKKELKRAFLPLFSQLFVFPLLWYHSTLMLIKLCL